MEATVERTFICRPACLIIHTGVRSTRSPRAVRKRRGSRCLLSVMCGLRPCILREKQDGRNQMIANTNSITITPRFQVCYSISIGNLDYTEPRTCEGTDAKRSCDHKRCFMFWCQPQSFVMVRICYCNIGNRSVFSRHDSTLRHSVGLVAN